MSSKATAILTGLTELLLSAALLMGAYTVHANHLFLAALMTALAIRMAA